MEDMIELGQDKDGSRPVVELDEALGIPGGGGIWYGLLHLPAGLRPGERQSNQSLGHPGRCLERI